MQNKKNKVIEFYIKTDKKPTKPSAMKELNLSLAEFNGYGKIIKSIQTIRALHQSIKNRSGDKYKFNGFKNFYNWYINEEQVCCYCGITEENLEAIKKNGWGTKRRRGSKLEVERVDTNSNNYSESNCALACYFCNNHKSDVITKEDFSTYFKEPMKLYLEKLSKTKKADIRT